MYLADAPIRSIVLGRFAYKALRADPKWEKLVHVDLLTRQNSGMSIGPRQSDENGVTYVGTLVSANVSMYVYDDDYVDPTTGTSTKFIAEDAVLLIPAAQFGWRCFGAIWDEAANFRGMPMFFKNWAENDPGIPYFMLQSAPMLAHTKINSTIGVLTGATLTGS
jgi:hypothetical protein